MKAFRIFTIIWCSLLLFCNCGKRQVVYEDISVMDSLVRDYQRHYSQHWGNKKSINDTLELQITFFQRNDSVFAVIEGTPYDLTGTPDVQFYLEWQNDSFSLRSDMLGYYRLGAHNLSVYDDVDNEHHTYIEPFLESLEYVDPHDKLKRHLELLEVYPDIDYYPFSCIYHIDDNSNYCLLDSGYFPQFALEPPTPQTDPLSPERIASIAGLELPPYKVINSEETVNEKSGALCTHYHLQIDTPVPSAFIEKLIELSTAKDNVCWSEGGPPFFFYLSDTCEVVVAKPITYIDINTISGEMELIYARPKE